MEILQTIEARNWLLQFKGGDVLLAKSLLNSIALISSSKFEAGLISQIVKISNNSKGKIALFPLKKKQDLIDGVDKPKRQQHGSEGRVAHLLTNQERSASRKYIVTPTLESMKAEKITDVVLFDDILGTGKRLTSSWLESINTQVDAQKTIKSWFSYKKVKLWVVTYAAYSKAVKLAVNSIGPLVEERILFSIELPNEPKWWNGVFEELCITYGKLTNKPGAALGFANSRCTLIFQHGCPNNCPSILWADGKVWKGLFPNRSIPSSLFNCFDNPSCNVGIESLFNTGQQKLAINLLNTFETGYQPKELLNILIILGLIRKRVIIDNLTKYTSLENNEIQLILNKMIVSGLIENDFCLTELGIEILEKFKSTRETRKNERKDNSSHGNLVYVPLQFFGCQRKFSGFHEVE